MATITTPDQVLHALRVGPEGLFVDERALAALKEQLVSLRQGEDLFGELRNILILGGFLLDRRQAPKAAHQLVELVSALAPRLSELAGAETDASRRAETLKAEVQHQRRALDTRRSHAALEPDGRHGVHVRKQR